MATIKASISFGLVYIPIKLELATRKKEITFHQLHRKNKKRIRYYKSCEDCERNVDIKDIVKAYEYDKNQYIIFEDADFEKIRKEKDRNIDIQTFINIKDIDPIYYEKTYFVTPDKSDKPFELLKLSLASSNKVGIAKFVMNNRESLVALRIKDKVMYMSILYFAEDLVSPPTYKTTKISKQEMDLASNLINQLTNKYQIEDFKDEYKERLKKAIEAKIKGKEIVSENNVSKNITVDLMTALKKSVQSSKRPRA